MRSGAPRGNSPEDVERPRGSAAGAWMDSGVKPGGEPAVGSLPKTRRVGRRCYGMLSQVDGVFSDT